MDQEKMSLQEKILFILEDQKGKSISGEAIANEMGVSRTAVWKAIKNLRIKGYTIQGATNQGYCLAIKNDIISVAGVRVYLDERYKKISIYIYDNLESTNLHAMLMALNGTKEETIIIAKELADSTGQQELELKSSGGLYFSLLIGQYLDIDQVALVPSIGVAVCVAIERLTENLIPSLRWIDDIYINQEKVGGIRIDSLINLETKENKVAVIGVNIDYEKINKLTKTTVEYNDKEIEKNALIAEIINQIMYSITEILQKQVMSEYKEKIQIIGKKIRIDNTNKETIGIVTDVLDDGSLLLESDGKQRQTVRYSENLIINVLD
mgnify:CR=1 FL=1